MLQISLVIRVFLQLTITATRLLNVKVGIDEMC